MKKKEFRYWWIIEINNYGDFAYYGTEEEAEEKRAFKAEWEGEIGRKKLASLNHPKVNSEIERLKKCKEDGCELNKRELEGIKNKWKI